MVKMFNKLLMLVFISALVSQNFIEAGLVTSVKVAVDKMKGYFRCDSHEDDQEAHDMLYNNKDDFTTEVVITKKIQSTIPTTDVTTKKMQTKIPTIDEITKAPKIDIRMDAVELDSRFLIDPPKNCPPGQQLGQGDKCRDIID